MTGRRFTLGDLIRAVVEQPFRFPPDLPMCPCTTVPVEDRSFEEHDKFMRKRLLRSLGVPPDVLGGPKDFNRATAQAAHEFGGRIPIPPRPFIVETDEETVIRSATEEEMAEARRAPTVTFRPTTRLSASDFTTTIRGRRSEFVCYDDVPRDPRPFVVEAAVDDQTFEKIKRGDVTGVSVGGTARVRTDARDRYTAEDVAASAYRFEAEHGPFNRPETIRHARDAMRAFGALDAAQCTKCGGWTTEALEGGRCVDCRALGDGVDHE